MDGTETSGHTMSALEHAPSSLPGSTEMTQDMIDGASLLGKTDSNAEGGESTLQAPSHSVTRELLQKHAAQLIEEINEKRKQNTQMVDDFRASQIAVVEKVCASMENHFIETYSKYEPDVQEKLQQFFDTLARIEQLETELEQFKSMLSNLCKDMRLV